ncbi:helix-turn-helix transcriptional regulator [Gottfriedia acidiceleris]|uniref:helix-turn-helix transcriptional regulator n=1 Tax=Gottfriedia acidiceleris TaxID=371036 RepID=UPI003D1C175E
MTTKDTIQEHVRRLDLISSHEEQIYKILQTFLKLFPVKKALLCRYSHLGYLGEGIISLTSTDILGHIRELRDDVRSIPIIYSAISENKVKYCSGIEYLKQTSSKYILPSEANSIVVVPITFGTVVVGYIISIEFTNKEIIKEELLSSLTLFGKLIGKFLNKNRELENTTKLSKRELEVMKRIANGESTKEMAVSMVISEITVKQYVKSSINKLGTNNRSHAVAELFRMGILT